MNSRTGLNASMQYFLNLMENLDPDPAHSRQVARLSVMLFDALEHLHMLGARERFLLEAASLCHDIGCSRDENDHHKSSRDILLASAIDDLDSREKVIVALVARYHRKTVPRKRHKHYRDLAEEDRLTVRKLSAILRIADGLDRTHRQVVRDIAVSDDGQTVTLSIKTLYDTLIERLAVIEKKKGLFNEVYGRKLKIVP